MRRWMGWGALAAGCLASAMANGCYFSATNRSIFAGKTYSTAPSDPPIAPDVELELFAHLQLETSARFYDPGKASKCMLSVDDCLLSHLGESLAKTTTSDGWARELAATALPEACDRSLDPRDQAYMRFVIGRVASVTEAISENTIRTVPDRAAVFAHAEAALHLLAPIVGHTSAPPAGAEDAAVQAPALALSGGAANGAFTAGFLFELLSVRERVLHGMAPAQRVAVDRRERFGAIAGTSVGSLIAQVLDLYFVDEQTPLTAAQQSALDECLGWWGQRGRDKTGTEGPCFDGYPEAQLPGPAPWSDSRRVQACALTKLFRYFTAVTEEQLMCVEPGPITQMFGALGQARPNMMRFDPMQTTIVDPVLEDFGPLLLGNSATRVVVSVQMEQNQTLGLDERACVGTADPTGCLASGVMASVVLPFFARPVRAVTSGYSRTGQDCGTWFDGGLRSGFPVERALLMTRPHEPGSMQANVLAVATERLYDLPSARPIDLMGVALNAVGQMSNQNFLSEAERAQSSEELRQRAYAILSGRSPEPAAVSDSTAADAGAPRPSRPSLPEAFNAIIPVYVPTEVPQQIVAESGYSFDPYVMRGLFVWGRREAIRRMRQRGERFDEGAPEQGAQRDVTPLCERLGWSTINDRSRKLLREDAHMLRAWSKAYSKNECAEHRKQRMKDGYARVSDPNIVHDCPAVTSKDAPPYFVCRQ